MKALTADGKEFVSGMTLYGFCPWISMLFPAHLYEVETDKCKLFKMGCAMSEAHQWVLLPKGVTDHNKAFSVGLLFSSPKAALDYEISRRRTEINRLEKQREHLMVLKQEKEEKLLTLIEHSVVLQSKAERGEHIGEVELTDV